MTRLENLLGVQALALADALLSGVTLANGPPVCPSDAAALVTLLAHPDQTVGWLGRVLGLTSSGDAPGGAARRALMGHPHRR